MEKEELAWSKAVLSWKYLYIAGEGRNRITRTEPGSGISVGSLGRNDNESTRGTQSRQGAESRNRIRAGEHRLGFPSVVVGCLRLSFSCTAVIASREWNPRHQSQLSGRRT